MSLILHIETATKVCSVALARDGVALCELHGDEDNAHSSRLATLVERLLSQGGVSFSLLDAVCVSSGPGSYTGLRIGVSSAKGYCYALRKPLLSVPTLLSMASLHYATHPDYDGLVCPMIDARRMECYAALYRREADGGVRCVRDVEADVITPGIYDPFLDGGKVCFVGDGAEKTRPLLGVHPNAVYDASFVVSAAGMAREAQRRLDGGEVEDVAYFEPFYLKDFVAKKSVVRGLR